MFARAREHARTHTQRRIKEVNSRLLLRHRWGIFSELLTRYSSYWMQNIIKVKAGHIFANDLYLPFNIIVAHFQLMWFFRDAEAHTLND
jgi:hypothetical protein